MIRKPTIFVLCIVLGFMGLYLYARHDLKRECPHFFDHPIPTYGSPAGTEEYDDMQTWTGCTDQDAIYLDMEQWVFYCQVSGVLLCLLILIDIAAYYWARSHRRDDFMHQRSKLIVHRRRMLHKISRFLGGL